jgi:hypothetical protein
VSGRGGLVIGSYDVVVRVGLSQIGFFWRGGGGLFPNFMHLINPQNMEHI